MFFDLIAAVVFAFLGLSMVWLIAKGIRQQKIGWGPNLLVKDLKSSPVGFFILMGLNILLAYFLFWFAAVLLGWVEPR